MFRQDTRKRHLSSRAIPGWGRIDTAQFRRLKLAALTGVFTLEGQAVAFLKSKRFTVDPGAFILSGQAVSLLRQLVLAADPGAFSVTGKDAGSVSGTGGASAAGTFVLSGQDVNLLRQLRMASDVGAFTVAGQAAGLLTSLVLAANVGSFAVTGQAAALLKLFRITADAGGFSVSGQAVGLNRLSSLVGAAGSFALTGNDVANPGIVSTFKTSISSSPSATSFTHTHNGGVRTGKWVVAIASRRTTAGTNSDPSTVTLAGTALSKLIGNTNSRQNVSIWISTTDITTDGTDDVAATWASNVQGSALSSLYSIDNLSSVTPVATAVSSTSPSALSVNTSAGGCVIAIGMNQNTTAFTWTNVTENFDSAPFGGNLQISGARADFASGSTPQTVTATHSSTEASAASVSLR